MSQPRLSGKTNSPSYERKRADAKARSAAQVLLGQDIGAIPPPRNLARRQSCATSFRIFCESYFKELFNLAWSKDHLRVIEKIERSVIHSETFAVAMPRGTGKTTLCMIAVIWAILEGYHSFVMLIAGEDELASRLLENIKSILSSNEELLADYPEAIYPIRSLQGESRRCLGQRYYGIHTHIRWDTDQIIMPIIPGSRCSEAVIRVAGITANIRGMMFVRHDGRSVRPSLAIVDDPQTEASARSATQVRSRLRVINGAVAGLAGPGKRIARIVPCTVIEEGDLADQLLDREKQPEWQGERTKMVYAFPTNETLWMEYQQLRRHSFRNGGRGETATEFYREHRAEMDEGAIVAWPERKCDDNELSAIQHAMNLRIKDPSMFAAEYQNEPLPLDEKPNQIIDADTIAAKTTALPRSQVPAEAIKLTAFIDVQGSLLYYMVIAWQEDFSGSIIEYGSYPDQRRDYYTLADARKTLQTVHKSKGAEGQIYAGLEDLTAHLLGKEWLREDGKSARIDRCLIDANWGNSTDTIYQFARDGKHAAIVMPSHGKSFTASTTPFGQYKKKTGELLGTHWWMPAMSRNRFVRHIIIDTNWWKTFSHSRLAVAKGDSGSLTLHASKDHSMIAEQLTSEYSVETKGPWGTVMEWKIKPGRPDNHLFDCLVGCCVAASMVGIRLGGMNAPSGPPPKRKRKSVSYL